MRLWSLHPCFLDSRGLVALWREALLARKVLEGRTTGYKEHPQLDRFKNAEKPVNALNFYISEVWKEADKRNFNFDRSKLTDNEYCDRMSVTDGQMEYEKKHLLRKLASRDREKHNKLKNIRKLMSHPLFYQTEGGVEEWEKQTAY